MTITKLVPGINPDVVKRGLDVYHLPPDAEIGLSGFLSAFDDRTVTIKGILGESGREESRTINADTISAGDYAALRYSDMLTDIMFEDADGWTVDGAVEIIDPDICRPGYFIMFRRSGTDAYTNGVITSVAEKSLRVSALAGSATLSVADVTMDGFEVMVSPVIEGGVMQGGATFERLEG